MSTEIIVNTTGREVRVAVMEHGRLVELQIDRGDARGFVGNVYLGRVVRVLPGMQAAFVDIGLDRAAFLFVGDIDPELLNIHQEKPTVEKPRAKPKQGQPAIQDLLKEGQQLVVQVSKDPIGTKGARLTTNIALPGRFVVLMPTVDHVGISRRIDRERHRRRLRDLVEKHRKKGSGYIVRTVCVDANNDSLLADMNFLEKSWQRIQDVSKEKKAPTLLHAEYNVVLRAVRDLFSDRVKRVVVDDRNLFDQVKSFMSDFMPAAKDRVHLYRGEEPIFDTYQVEGEVTRCMGRKVWLKSGGYLVIDQTEALMAIDVNSGKFVGSSSLEDTTTQINLEAVDEVVAQLRLRNIGGIIIIDFIDMDKETNRDKVYKALEHKLKADRARTNVLQISDLGLVEMTRKRVQEGLDRYLTDDCPTCSGTGTVRGRKTVAYDVLRELKRQANRVPRQAHLFVNTTPEVAELLYSDQFSDLQQVEKQLSRQITIRAMGHYHPTQFEVYHR